MSRLIYRREAHVPGTKIPWWMGICWHDHCRDELVTAAMPLNLALRWARSTYYRALSGWGPTWIDRERKAAWKGGYEEGLRVGKEVGREDTFKELEGRLDKVVASDRNRMNP